MIKAAICPHFKILVVNIYCVNRMETIVDRRKTGRIQVIRALESRVSRYDFRNVLSSRPGSRFSGVHLGSSLKSRIALIY